MADHSPPTLEPVKLLAALPSTPDFEIAIAALRRRQLPGDGFAETAGGVFRPDATAWAALCLEACSLHPALVASARKALADRQMTDGNLPLAPDHPDAVWPTAAAALALQGDPRFQSAHAKTVAFLLAATGGHSPKEPDSPLGHDSSIPGWSWIAGTHSWVEPTAMAVRALATAGRADHQRVRDGVRLLLDRQLPDGGWNCGVTTVYGKILPPVLASTGLALWSLGGLVERPAVQTSLILLERNLPELHTPLSLGWALLGLAAWNGSTQNADGLVRDCLQRQSRYGDYGTSQLCILLMAAAWSGPRGTSHA